MDDKKMVHLFDGVDDELVRQANEDINLWLESQEGVVVHANNRRSPWKTVAASVAGIAAAFGVFALTLNAVKIRNSADNVYSEGDNAPNSSLTEQLADYNVENLDCENAVVVESAPISGQWRKMTFENPGINENSADRMEKIAEAYGAAVNKDDILLRMWKEDSTFDENKPLSEVNLSKYDDLQYTDRDKVPYNSMFYSSEDLFIEIDEPGHGFIIMDNRKAVNNFLGRETDPTGAWYPSSDFTSGSHVEPSYYSVEPNDETATCVLDGKTVKVADAVRNAQNLISEYDALFPKGLDTTVRSVTVFTYANGSQSLKLNIVYTFDGVPFTSAPSHEFKENRDSNRAFSFHYDCVMLTENTIDMIWFDEIDGATEFKKEGCDIAVSREDAIKLASQALSKNETFNVEEILLQYVSRRVDGGRSYVSEPTWQFCITGGSDELYVYVSAVDGTVNIFEEGR